jgi:riboflavin synthase
MFTGIVQGMATVESVQAKGDIVTWSVRFPSGALSGVSQGASISLDGCCLTVTGFFADDKATFDLVPETIARTSFKDIRPGSILNYERSLRFGDEVGGHVLSGHVDFVAQVVSVQELGESRVVVFQCPVEWTRYLFTKGYIALNGASLTLTVVERERGQFSVSLIPETLAKTTFGNAKPGGNINVEIDRSTQAIVETVERVMREMGEPLPK